MEPDEFDGADLVLDTKCLYDKLVPISELKKHPKNPNKHSSEQIERLAKILKYQGWRYPIKVSKLSGFITSGHGRLEAAVAMGLTLVPVNYQDYESSEQEYADVVSDNSIASWAELDLESIRSSVNDLPTLPIDLLGIKDFDACESIAMAKDEEPEEPARECPKCGHQW